MLLQGKDFAIANSQKYVCRPLDDNGFPTETTPIETKLIAYNGILIAQHGVCSIQCAYDDNKTEAQFYVTEVDGPATCGLPTSCHLKLADNQERQQGALPSTCNK